MLTESQIEIRNKMLEHLKGLPFEVIERIINSVSSEFKRLSTFK